ncbi:MAG: hypothetical protein Q9182_007655 [Xanthomendoza sp. 2 TL-2023]
MSQSYIEAHKADEAVRTLEQKVSLLITKSKEQTGKNENFEKKIRSLEKKNEDLETRLKASTHNALARHLNALLPPSSPHHPLHPLHNIHTNTPLPHFPKKESDIRTLSSHDVTTLLKDLDADIPPASAGGERKSRLKEIIGVGERGSVVGAIKEAGVEGVDGVKEEKKKEVKLPGKATGPPPGKVLPIGPRD